MNKTGKELIKNIEYLYSKINWGASAMDAKAIQIMNSLPWSIHEAIRSAVCDTAQEAYLECLAVHCGESECTEAIKSKFDL